jgi:parallel beta-helix repeat protein
VGSLNGITFTLALLLMFCGTASATQLYVTETGWWSAGGTFNANDTPIQAAVNGADVGDMIFVWNGSYTENVNVNKRLTIEGEGADVVAVTARSLNDQVFGVTANRVNISGFAVSGAMGSCGAGIYLYYADHCNIHNNRANSNRCGIWLHNSSDNTLTENTANSNIQRGIYIYGIDGDSSNRNTLARNTASGNGYDGICLESSSNNTLTDNTANSNMIGIYLHNSSSNNTLTDNTANSNIWRGICLESSSNNNTLTNNTANSNIWRGICVLSSSNQNTLTNNTVNTINGCDLCIAGSESTFADNTLNNTTVSFTHNGDVSLKGMGSPAADPSPSGWQSIGKFINATNQSAGAWVFLNFSYSDSDAGGSDESSLRVLRYDGIWHEDSGAQYLNTAANVVGVNITSFGVFAPMLHVASSAPPNITSFAPPVSVSDTEGTTRVFEITVDQTVDVTWLINGAVVATVAGVTEASYTNTSAATGVWNVSAVVANANGAAMQTWTWNIPVTAERIPGDVNGDSEVNIGDAVLLFNWVSFPNERETMYTLAEPKNADVTGDDEVNIGDAVLLFNWVSFPNERGTTYVLQ